MLVNYIEGELDVCNIQYVGRDVMYVGETCVYFHVISPSYYCLNMRLSNITDTTEMYVGEGFPRILEQSCFAYV